MLVVGNCNTPIGQLKKTTILKRYTRNLTDLQIENMFLQLVEMFISPKKTKTPKYSSWFWFERKIF